MLVAVALINALIDFIQEIKSEQALKSFMDLVPRKTMCVRQGQMQSMEATNLVPGDVIFIRMGDKLPADVYLIRSTDFKVSFD